MMNRHSILLILSATVMTFISCERDGSCTDMTLTELSENFKCPPQEFGPYVWWHWPGPNFSKSGIEKDLQAMKESGIAGATIFNVTSDVHTPLRGILNTPWPEQTYRSEAYWDALEHAAEVAEEFGLKIGLHNTPGYATTGGPWIDEQRGIQKLVFSETDIAGGNKINVGLPMPEPPIDCGWGSTSTPATLYTDIAVMAVPEDAAPYAVLDITEAMDENGNLNWNAPEGNWRIFRIGQAPSMSSPHPLPEDLIGKAKEADKMNREASEYHWDNVLKPLKEHLGQYIGKSFTHILIDSYEADCQNWTYGFRKEFEKECGYDPLPFIACSFADGSDQSCDSFEEDMKRVVNRLYFENGWNVAAEKIHEAGLLFYWEPYFGPFDTGEGAALADLPMGEFWTDTDGRILPEIVEAAKESHKRIVGAEAFTGKYPESGYTEDPAFLKHTTDGAFVSGVNLLFLHHWTHQPFDERYKPGMSMGVWGTHFGRNQTWFEPGKEFIRYITRCQMMLRQGVLQEVGEDFIHRTTADAEIFFIVNQSPEEVCRTVACEGGTAGTELWDAYTGKIYDASPITENSDGKVSVSMNLKPAESMFVIFDRKAGRISGAEKLFIPRDSRTETVEGDWNVVFRPATGEEDFEVDGFGLSDFSLSNDERIRYFAGTAVYSKRVDFGEVTGDRVLLDLGEMNDIAVLKMNGQSVGVLWNPPYVGDVTGYLKPGENLLEIEVTVNWANRLIGDERYEADVEWDSCSHTSSAKALKAFPDWLVKGEPRPSKERKTFANYTYYDASSPLQKAGLVGPVRIVQIIGFVTPIY